jgi:hypothetical protein
MTTLLRLAALINRFHSGADAAKLRPAMYLAQHRLGTSWYNYRLAQGRVFSDELDLDLSQLESGGLLRRVCGTGSRSFKFIPHVANEGLQQWLTTSDELLVQQVRELLDEDREVLDAAATSSYFGNEELGEPGEHLRWYRALSEPERTRASELAEDAR